MKLVDINQLKCSETNKEIDLHFLISKPKVEYANYTLQNFNCSNQDYCNFYKEKKCPKSNLWKQKI